MRILLVLIAAGSVAWILGCGASSPLCTVAGIGCATPTSTSTPAPPAPAA